MSFFTAAAIGIQGNRERIERVVMKMIKGGSVCVACLALQSCIMLV